MRNKYDEDLLVELIARGELTQRQIAERIGISRSAVWKIANGNIRADLHERIAEAVEGHRTDARRLGVKWLKPLLTKQIKEGMSGDGETARKCREYALNKFLDSPASQADRDRSQPPAPHLTAEDYEIIARSKGGPSSD